MKWKTRFRRTATTTSAILLALMLTACSDNNGANNSPVVSNSNSQAEQDSIPDDSLPDETGVLDPGTLTSDNDKESTDKDAEKPEVTNNKGDNSDDAASEIISAKGTYIGAADGHSVEIQIGDETIVFQIDDSLTHIIDEFDSDQAVSIQYVEKAIDGMDIKQPWLTKIEKQ